MGFRGVSSGQQEADLGYYAGRLPVGKKRAGGQGDTTPKFQFALIGRHQSY